MSPDIPRPQIVPMIRYRNLPRMADWLCTAFGFERDQISTSGGSSVPFVQLRLGASLIIVGKAQDAAGDPLMVQPDQIDGCETQSCYIVVGNAEAHCLKAVAAGAEILSDVELVFDDRASKPERRSYVCRDPEGHLWSFGSYDPWTKSRFSQPLPLRPQRGRSAAMATGVAFVAAVSLAAAWPHISRVFQSPYSVVENQAVASGEAVTSASVKSDAEASRRLGETFADELASARNQLDAAERSARAAHARLASEQAARAKAEQAAAEASAELRKLTMLPALERKILDLQQELTDERLQRNAAQRAAKEAADQFERARAAREQAERTAASAAEKSARDSVARLAAERAAREALEQLAPERNARAAAELAANELRNELQTVKRGSPQDSYHQLKEQLASEQAQRLAAEQAAKSARQQLAQENALRSAAEHSLKSVQAQLNSPQAHCWAQPPLPAATRTQ